MLNLCNPIYWWDVRSCDGMLGLWCYTSFPASFKAELKSSPLHQFPSFSEWEVPLYFLYQLQGLPASWLYRYPLVVPFSFTTLCNSKKYLNDNERIWDAFHTTLTQCFIFFLQGWPKPEHISPTFSLWVVPFLADNDFSGFRNTFTFWAWEYALWQIKSLNEYGESPSNGFRWNPNTFSHLESIYGCEYKYISFLAQEYEYIYPLGEVNMGPPFNLCCLSSPIEICIEPQLYRALLKLQSQFTQTVCVL